MQPEFDNRFAELSPGASLDRSAGSGEDAESQNGIRHRW
jgi:hypothetical protein